MDNKLKIKIPIFDPYSSGSYGKNKDGKLVLKNLALNDEDKIQKTNSTECDMEEGVLDVLNSTNIKVPDNSFKVNNQESYVNNFKRGKARFLGNGLKNSRKKFIKITQEGEETNTEESGDYTNSRQQNLDTKPFVKNFYRPIENKTFDKKTFANKTLDDEKLQEWKNQILLGLEHNNTANNNIINNRSINNNFTQDNKFMHNKTKEDAVIKKFENKNYKNPPRDNFKKNINNSPINPITDTNDLGNKDNNKNMENTDNMPNNLYNRPPKNRLFKVNLFRKNLNNTQDRLDYNKSFYNRGDNNYKNNRLNRAENNTEGTLENNKENLKEKDPLNSNKPSNNRFNRNKNFFNKPLPKKEPNFLNEGTLTSTSGGEIKFFGFDYNIPEPYTDRRFGQNSPGGANNRPMFKRDTKNKFNNFTKTDENNRGVNNNINKPEMETFENSKMDTHKEVINKSD